MTSVSSIRQRAADIESIVALCCGIPQGDELPQVPSREDVVADICSDVLNMPRGLAAGRIHHQFDDGLDGDILH